jgi:tRNA(adenine34) deaminase
MTNPSDELWMRHALNLAEAAAALGEVPVGAVVVRDDRIVAQAMNLRESLHDPTAHAERLALQLAGRALGHWRLVGCTVYVTLEPCTMCAGALVLARVDRVVFGCRDPKAGACGSLYMICSDQRLNHRPVVTPGVLANECGSLLSLFFRAKRTGCASGPPDSLNSSTTY